MLQHDPMRRTDQVSAEHPLPSYSSLKMQRNITSSTPTTATAKSATTAADVPSVTTTKCFESFFETFIQANSSKSIVKSFDHMCKHLKFHPKQIYENGFNLNASSASIGAGFTAKNSPMQISGSAHHQNKINSSSNLNYRLNNMSSSSLANNSASFNNTRLIYKIIKSKTNYWKANELWKKYDKKANSKDYAINRNLHEFKDLNILIIGCGPVGLRLSIECALMGFKCTIVEKRDRFSRNNVLHLWPFTIIDLKNLGAKLFYGKFCAGSIDHISIRKLQCILLKVALLLGVQVHFNTQFEEILEPIDNSNTGQLGWGVRILPENHPLASKHFDVVIGADGRRNSLPGFKHKEFRGKLAIGITANFTNYHTTEEAEVEERSGVAFIFDQRFFLDLRDETGIDLENIVYYKDDTHYFVMTAKRQSLIDKDVIKQDFPDAMQLLSKDNVNFDKLCDYAKEAAYNSTNKKLTRLDFAKNHYGQPDVAMFDFTSLFQSENASRLVERKGRRLFMALVGDSLLEPFWPTGTGVARGFLAAMDTAWSIKGFANGKAPLDLLIERESIYQLLSQTTHDNISKNYQDYTVDPFTRYINLNTKILQEAQIKHLFDNGTSPISSIKNKCTLNNVQSQTLMHWCQMVVQSYNIKVENFSTSWENGTPLFAIIHRFNPDLIDYQRLNENSLSSNIQSLFDIMRNKLGLVIEASPGEFINNIPDKFTVLMILDKLYALFKNHELKDVDFETSFDTNEVMLRNPVKRKMQKSQDDGTIFKQNKPEVAFNQNKRASLKDGLTSVFKNKIEFFNNNDLNTRRVSATSEASRSGSDAYSVGLQQRKSEFISGISQTTSTCYLCNKKVFLMERLNVMDFFMHANCFKCQKCQILLKNGVYNHYKDPVTNRYLFYCSNHNHENNLSQNRNNAKISRFMIPERDQAAAKYLLDENLKQFESKYNSFRNKNDPVNNPTDNKYHIYQRIGDARRIDEFKENFLLNTEKFLRERAEFESLASESGKNEEGYEEEEEEDDDDDDGDDEDEYDSEDDDNNEEESDQEYDEETEYEEDEEEGQRNEAKNYKVLNSNSCLNEAGLDLPFLSPPPILARSMAETNMFDTKKNFLENVVFRNNKRKDPFCEISLSQPRPLTRLFTKNATDGCSKSDQALHEFSNNRGFSFPQPDQETARFNVESAPPLASYRKTQQVPLASLIDLTPKTTTKTLANPAVKRTNIPILNNFEHSSASDASASLCNFCKKSLSNSARVQLEKNFYHDQCVKCVICKLKLNEDQVYMRTFNSNVFFYCEDHIQKELSRHIKPSEFVDNLITDLLNKSVYVASPTTPTVINQFIQNSILNKSQTQNQSQSSRSSSSSASSLYNKVSKAQNRRPPPVTSLSEPLKLTDCSKNPLCNQLTPTITEQLKAEARFNETKEAILNEIVNSEHRVILDIYMMRQRAQEKAKLKSDEELGVQINIPSSIKKKTIPIPIHGINEKNNPLHFQSISGRAVKKLQAAEGLSGLKKYAESDSEYTDTFNLATVDKLSDSEIGKNGTAAPLAKSEIFENLIEEEDEDVIGNLSGWSNYDTSKKYLDDRYENARRNSQQNQAKKRIIPDMKLESSSNSDESNSSLDNIELVENADDDRLESSFNALNLRHSPCLSRNSRTVKLNTKRTQYEEKRLEKQKRDKRLRVSQEIQRNLDEIENKLDELEHDGVQLEKMISEIGEPRDSVAMERKEKLEQELYRLIHEKNLLTRAENDLNIKRRALAVEDQLSECQLQLRESLNIPDSQKTIEIISKEKSIMEKIVDLVEQKNQLVEQLESLRQIAYEEDTHVQKTFMEKKIKINENKNENLIEKYKYYSDII